MVTCVTKFEVSLHLEISALFTILFVYMVGELWLYSYMNDVLLVFTSSFELQIYLHFPLIQADQNNCYNQTYPVRAMDTVRIIIIHV